MNTLEELVSNIYLKPAYVNSVIPDLHIVHHVYTNVYPYYYYDNISIHSGVSGMSDLIVLKITGSTWAIKALVSYSDDGKLITVDKATVKYRNNLNDPITIIDGGFGKCQYLIEKTLKHMFPHRLHNFTHVSDTFTHLNYLGVMHWVSYNENSEYRVRTYDRNHKYWLPIPVRHRKKCKWLLEYDKAVKPEYAPCVYDAHTKSIATIIQRWWWGLRPHNPLV